MEILVVREPDKLIDATVDIAWRIRLTYPEGPRDSEAIAVDAANERILILSKREYPQKLYQSALRESGEAVLISTLPGLPQATHADFAEEPDTAQYRHMPSGMDYFPETDALLLTTYKHAYLYRLNALEAGPILIPMPSVGQREAISWLSENSAVVSRERPQGVGVSDLFMIEILTY